MNFVVETSDGHMIEITEEMVKFSNIWKEMINDNDDDDDVIKLPVNVRKELIDKVVEFTKLSLDEPVGEISKPIPGNTESFSSISGIPSWAEDWLKPLTKEELQLVVLCSNYLDIQPLLHMCSAYIAFNIKGKTPDEIINDWKDITNPNPSIA
jgi:hypothetical protein